MVLDRYSALLIKHGAIGTDITLDVYGPVDGKYGFWITFCKEGRPHICPLVEATPQYETEQAARDGMDRLVKDIKAMDLP